MLITLRVIFLLLVVCCTTTLQAKTTIKVVVVENEFERWNEFKSKSKTAIHELSTIELGSKRIIADLVIMTQAFEKSGAEFELEFIIAPNHKRAIAMVNSGEVVITGSDLFRNVLPESAFISSAIIREGETSKAIFGLSSNKKLMSVKTLNDLQQLSAVSLPNWRTDWAIMSALNVKELHAVNRYQLALNLISERGIDFTLRNLPTEPGEIIINDVSMSFVDGVKINLPGSRHFLISKAHPLGAQVYEKLEAGLLILRKENKIKTFMQNSNILNKYSEDWKVLNE